MDSPKTVAAHYNDTVVRQFSIMAVVWGVIGMLVGVVIAAQLAWPELNFGIPWLSYGRLRPLHTNAVIFAFGGCALFATSLHVVQRTCHVRLISDRLAAFVFWGWQAVIVLAAVTLPLGMTQGKEYAELEWPIDILIALVWVAYAVVFFGTIIKRRVPHIFVANWFYGAFVLTVAVLHIVNSAALPAGWTKSYPAYAGAVDAMEPVSMADAEGTAEPNAVVTLYLGGRKLGETQAATDGRWRFQLLDFPPGRYSIRVEAWTGLQSIPSQEVSFMMAPEQSPAKAKQASKAKRTKPGMGSGAR